VFLDQPLMDGFYPFWSLRNRVFLKSGLSLEIFGYLCLKDILMGIPRFFRIPKHKQFNYRPIYYDERKERLEERVKEIEQEFGIKNGKAPMRTMTRGSFSHYHLRKKKAQRYSTTRLILIIIFLLFVSYYLFFF